ncbi:hypothetical protein GCM10011363_27310 [Marivita lacus]|uniref:Uncharacterized protein n=1 Tax=Marivita lacus TaxID=1323742 RepID=A0ABQ1KY54_9RHOB|nr:hypothetical protein GCM10011363_27310 [Marivita lacus]
MITGAVCRKGRAALSSKTWFNLIQICRIELALMHHIASRDEGSTTLVQLFKDGQLDLRQGDEGRELARQRAVFS